jgi:hypothetical protein
MAQMQTISVRISDEDFQWLLSLPEPGAKTPSEKLRALVAKAREQDGGMADYKRCAGWMRGLTQPFTEAIADVDHRYSMHSDLVTAISEGVPQIMATLITERPEGTHANEKAVEAEAALARQCFRLLSGLLRSAITSTPATYDKQVLDDYLPDILEIAEIISTRKERETKNG